jgi:beta-mannanase
MYRHVVQRLRIDGVANLVTVVNYMGYPEWSTKPWFDDLYPGDDVVDWIAQDPYASAATSGYLATDFKGTVNRSQGSYPGFYSWAAAEHPGKPLMLGEWGVFESAANPNGKPAYYTSVQSQLGQFPELKAILYFDSPNAPKGDTKIDTTEAAQTAFRKLANSTEVTGK